MTQPSTLTIPPSVVPFLAVGTAAVVTGGLVAAVTGPTSWDDGSWVAAFLVLVTGVGQIGLAAGQDALADCPIPRRRIVSQMVLLNGGSALVILGTLTSLPVVVGAGALLLAGAFTLVALTPRGAGTQRVWIRRIYLGLLVLLTISTPIGVALAWIRT